jgi:hypothetical protein
MATSGTTNFNPTRDQIINEALEILGVLGDGDTAAANDRATCALTLNLIIKNWVIKGWIPSLYQTVTHTLVAGTPSYTIGPSGADITANRPARIAQAWQRFTTGGIANDTPLTILSRQEYNMLTPKTIAGISNCLYYDAQITTGVLYPWPIVNQTGYTLVISFERQFQDVATTSSASTETFDVSQEWFLPLAWTLAKLVAPKYTSNLQKQQMIAANADMYLEQVADFNREEATVMFQPNPMMGR